MAKKEIFIYVNEYKQFNRNIKQIKQIKRNRKESIIYQDDL